MNTDPAVDEFIARIENFPKPQNPGQRRRLWEAARALQTRIEDENTTQHRILGSPLLLIVSRLASDLGIFNALIDNVTPSSVPDLAVRCKVDERLLARILRYLSSQHLVTESSPSHFTTSVLTRTLAKPAYAAGLRFAHECILPATSAAPAFFESTHYAHPTSPTNTPFQLGQGVSDHMFTWLKQRPALEADFNAMMAETHRWQRSVWEQLPLPAVLADRAAAFPDRTTVETTPSRPLFVDIGGGTGRTCKELKEAFPHLPGRIINQDRAPALAAGLTVDGLEHMEHDFFTPQPITGARVYYLRRVLHNWPRAKCVEILTHCVAAMAADSLLMIDEIVLPERGAHWHLAYADFTMMALFGGGCRSRAEFEGICKEVGLRVVREFVYMVESGETALVAEKV
ncbi:S-adenosyl-L-methionine-dependent methyltransferase [Pseudovirgaria hyperparasitica]|uniref:S-adenosyl-L-methionine-dependent methyltransferase n=1 Tax=Pseudovirgaria hyperparasitica TaxID=470096 RepID=A0A6A6W1N2_9PEZI|nr:S-adenosyl-L-methionine-dependent methyltransferase [Pseudovirgaria hyperparasitica]KAF2756049.1 S-adenosyl-L-methionine-dependent methyltransferase [Pseudovirgaria hyperparasitica]